MEKIPTFSEVSLFLTLFGNHLGYDKGARYILSVYVYIHDTCFEETY